MERESQERPPCVDLAVANGGGSAAGEALAEFRLTLRHVTAKNRSTAHSGRSLFGSRHKATTTTTRCDELLTTGRREGHVRRWLPDGQAVRRFHHVRGPANIACETFSNIHQVGYRSRTWERQMMTGGVSWCSGITAGTRLAGLVRDSETPPHLLQSTKTMIAIGALLECASLLIASIRSRRPFRFSMIQYRSAVHEQ